MSLNRDVYVLKRLYDGEPRGLWNKPRSVGYIRTRVSYEEKDKFVNVIVVCASERPVIVKQHAKDLPTLQGDNKTHIVQITVDNAGKQKRDRHIASVRENLKPKYGDNPKFNEIVMALFNVNRLTFKTNAIRTDLEKEEKRLNEFKDELRSLLPDEDQ